MSDNTSEKELSYWINKFYNNQAQMNKKLSYYSTGTISTTTTTYFDTVQLGRTTKLRIKPKTMRNMW